VGVVWELKLLMKTLDELGEGNSANIVSIKPCEIKRRLIEMGFVKGSEIHVVKYAPLRDPIELLIKGYHVFLRRDEARYIEIEEN